MKLTKQEYDLLSEAGKEAARIEGMIDILEGRAERGRLLATSQSPHATAHVKVPTSVQDYAVEIDGGYEVALERGLIARVRMDKSGQRVTELFKRTSKGSEFGVRLVPGSDGPTVQRFGSIPKGQDQFELSFDDIGLAFAAAVSIAAE